MARTRVDLQPVRNMTGNYIQPANEAARVGANRNGVVFVNVFKVQATPNVVIAIESATDPSLGDATGTSYWQSVGNIATINAAGVYRSTITDLADLIRFRTSSIASELSFSIVVFLNDQA